MCATFSEEAGDPRARQAQWKASLQKGLQSQIDYKLAQQREEKLADQVREARVAIQIQQERDRLLEQAKKHAADYRASARTYIQRALEEKETMKVRLAEA